VGRLRRFGHHGAGAGAQLTRVIQAVRAGRRRALSGAARGCDSFASVLDYIEQSGDSGNAADDHHPRGIAGLGIAVPAALRSRRRPTTGRCSRSLFWGARFALETQFLGEGDYAALLKARRQAKGHSQPQPQPDDHRRRRSAAPGARRPGRRLRAQSPGVEVNADDNARSIRDVVVKAKTDATLIYSSATAARRRRPRRRGRKR
jgi:hypothetical protein